MASVAPVTLNSFLEDTCVLVASAFVLVRGPFERLIHSRVWLGVVAGAFAASESVFPGDRYPYAPHTLACAFAITIAGPVAGLIAAGMAIVAAFSLLPFDSANIIAVQVLATVAIMSLVSRWVASRWWDVPASAAGQLGGIFLAHAWVVRPNPVLMSPVSAPANVFGLVLLLLVVRDARLREASHRHVHEIDEARRIAAEARLAIVRTRVQPHFLFNSLNSIAALCIVSPARASEAATHLGRLMRKSLELDMGKGLRLSSEMETVASYVAVEKERFGSKLTVSYDVGQALDLEVPAFSIQILVENAIQHGVTPKSGPGQVCVSARVGRSGTTIFVIDDGVGISETGSRRDSPHGLTILRDQLQSICGPSARLHLVKREKGGTIAAFSIPNPMNPKNQNTT